MTGFRNAEGVLGAELFTSLRLAGESRQILSHATSRSKATTRRPASIIFLRANTEWPFCTTRIKTTSSIAMCLLVPKEGFGLPTTLTFCWLRRRSEKPPFP